MPGRRLLLVVALSTLGGALASGCDAKLVILTSNSRISASGGGGAGGAVSVDFGGTAGLSVATGGMTFACTGYDCHQIDCAGNGTTSVSGTVYDPAGKVPLYNVVLYVPDVAPDPIEDGLGKCDRCSTPVSGQPIAATLSDPNGHFLLTDVPPGDDIPIVIQIGKWRRQITIPHVEPCTETKIMGSELTRLPRNQSEGHIPQIGVTTGHSDALECLLRKIGIDDSEFTTDAGTGRVHMYLGCDGGNGYGANRFSAALGGAAFPPAATLWGTTDKLTKYDVLLFSCEGSQCASEKQPYLANIKAYADAGGRLFLDHDHFYWLNHNVAAWQSSADYVGNGGEIKIDPFTTQIDTSFPKGQAFGAWLFNVGASTTAGQLDVHKIEFSVRDAYPPKAQQWIYTHDNPLDPTGHAVEYMTMNTPVELATAGGAGGADGAGGGANGAEQCGRVVFTDLHVATVSLDVSHDDTPFPDGCVDPKPPLTPQEKALEFMIFDLTSCVQAERDIPVPPELFIK